MPVIIHSYIGGLSVGLNQIENTSQLSGLVVESGLQFSSGTLLNTSQLSSLVVGNGLQFSSGTNLSLSSYVEYQVARTSNLTAQTSTLTTLTVAASISFTATVTGFYTAIVYSRIANSTVGDGITAGLYLGTVLLDSETYTQEGLGGNGHTSVLAYSGSIALSTAEGFTVQYNAVTGGTAQIKIVSFEVKEVSVV